MSARLADWLWLPFVIPSKAAATPPRAVMLPKIDPDLRSD